MTSLLDLLRSSNSPLSLDTYVNSQLQCALFYAIPTEIRLAIFILSLASYIAEEDLYDPETHYTRPGHEGERTYPTSLLWTCKRIYLETHNLPLKLSTHSLTFYFERPPPNYQGPDTFISTVHPKNLFLINTIHLNLQQCWLEKEASFTTVLHPLTIIPTLKVLRIVIRHGDWWYWESNNKLGIDPYQTHHPVTWYATVAAYRRAVSKGGRRDIQLGSRAWGAKLSGIPTLEKFEMEFETLTSKRDQLDLIVAFSKYWRFPMPDGRFLVRDQAVTEAYGWNGPKSFIVDNTDAVPIKDDEIKTRPELLFTYQVRVVTWRKAVTEVEVLGHSKLPLVEVRDESRFHMVSSF